MQPLEIDPRQLAAAVGHYLVLDTAQDRRTHLAKSRERAARDASLAPLAQDALARMLAQTYLDTIPTADRHTRTRLEAYNIGFTRSAPAEVNDAVTPVAHTPVTPLWAVHAQQLAAQATGTETDGGWRSTA